MTLVDLKFDYLCQKRKKKRRRRRRKKEEGGRTNGRTRSKGLEGGGREETNLKY